VTRAVPYAPSRFTWFACAAGGLLLACAGLWFCLGRPTLSWYESYLLHSNAWSLAALIGVVMLGNILYWFLTFLGRLKQAA
jgi:hypothetical protein